LIPFHTFRQTQPSLTMSAKTKKTETCIWSSIRERAMERASSEPMLASFLHATVLNHERFEDAVSYHLAGKLASSTLSAMQLREIMLEAMIKDPSIADAICADIRAVRNAIPP
jgi:serine O-acetyltransferase